VYKLWAYILSLTIFQVDDIVETVAHEKAFLHPEYGANMPGAGNKVVIEKSSPNISKSFHVGHLHSTNIGAFVKNLYKLVGGKSCRWIIWEIGAHNLV